MTHPVMYQLPMDMITNIDPYQVATALDDILNEMDHVRHNNPGYVEDRLDRIEAAVLLLATAVRNGTIGDKQ